MTHGFRIVLTAGLLLLPGATSALDLNEALDRHALAHGFSRDVAPRRALHMVADMEAFGLTGTLETWTEPPMRIWTKLDLGPLTIENGFDGEDGWIRDRNGATRAAVGSELSGLWLDALLQGGAYVLRDPPLPLDRSLRPGEEAGTVELTLAPREHQGQTLILDAATFRLLRSQWRGALGPEQTIYDDYRDFDGALLPYQLRMHVGEAMELSARIQSYEFHPPRGRAAYARPDRSTDDIELAGDRSQALPMRGLGTHILLFGRIGEREGDFLLDSGAGGNVLHDKVARELGLSTVGEVEASGVAGFAEAGFVDVEKVDLGDLSLRDQSWMSLDFGAIGAAIGGDLIGVLGYDTFQRLVVEIDYQDRWVRFHKPEAFTPPADAVAVPIRLDANVPTAQVLLNGVESWVHLDTGSDNTLDLGRRFVRESGLEDELPDQGPTALLGVGGMGTSQRVQLGELQLADFGFEEMSAFVHESGSGAIANSDVAGVLGAGVLSRFHCTFDYSRSTLWLIPNRHYAAPVPSSLAGLTVRRRGHRLVVTAVRAGSPAHTAGLRAGDEVVALNNRSIAKEDMDALRRALEGASGRRVKLRFVRNGLSRHRQLLLPSG